MHSRDGDIHVIQILYYSTMDLHPEHHLSASHALTAFGPQGRGGGREGKGRGACLMYMVGGQEHCSVPYFFLFNKALLRPQFARNPGRQSGSGSRAGKASERARWSSPVKSGPRSRRGAVRCGAQRWLDLEMSPESKARRAVLRWDKNGPSGEKGLRLMCERDARQPDGRFYS